MKKGGQECFDSCPPFKDSRNLCGIFTAGVL